MERTKLVEDLEFVRTMAEEGRAAPLVGGRLLALWGFLFTLTLLVHWAVVTNTLNIGAEYLIWLWLGMSAFGGLATALIDRQLREAPGISAANNRAAGAVWGALPFGLFALFAGAFAGIAWFDAPLVIWNVLPATALALYGVAHLSTGFFHRDWLSLAAGAAALISAAACLALVQHSAAYLAAAAGATFSALIPGLIQWANEPKLTA